MKGNAAHNSMYIGSYVEMAGNLIQNLKISTDQELGYRKQLNQTHIYCGNDVSQQIFLKTIQCYFFFIPNDILGREFDSDFPKIWFWIIFSFFFSSFSKACLSSSILRFASTTSNLSSSWHGKTCKQF